MPDRRSYSRIPDAPRPRGVVLVEDDPAFSSLLCAHFAFVNLHVRHVATVAGGREILDEEAARIASGGKATIGCYVLDVFELNGWTLNLALELARAPALIVMSAALDDPQLARLLRTVHPDAVFDKSDAGAIVETVLRLLGPDDEDRVREA